MDIDDRARVLVVVMNQPRDLAIAREEGWYRIPVRRAPPRIAAEYLAFYQTAAFGTERWAIRYFATIRGYRLMLRRQLLPQEGSHPRADDQYYRIDLGPLEQLPLPVPAARLRRISFIATSFGRLRLARDVVELWNPDEDPDDELWGAGMAGKSL